MVSIKKLLTTLILSTLLVPMAWGQAEQPKLSGAEKQADGYIVTQQFDKAEAEYKSILGKRNLDAAEFNRVSLKLATMYYMLKRFDEAEKVFIQADTDINAFSPQQASYYIYTLIQLNKKEEAALKVDKFLSRHPFSADIALQNLQRGIKSMDEPADRLPYTIDTAPFNLQGSNFWCAQYNGGILFIHTGTSNEDMLKGAQYYFYNGSTSQPYSGIELTMQAGPASIAKDGSVMLYTDNRYGSKAPRRLKDSKIVFNPLRIMQLSQNKKKGGWNKAEEQFKTKSDETYCHPALSDDNQRLYFSSDRAGSLGGLDLYMAKRTEKGWGEPVNLGKMVNTEGYEVFPLVRGDKLYFSSNGLKGQGGQDVYVVTLDKDGFPIYGTLENLSFPINSPYNDYGLMYIDDSWGYFSSDRPNGSNIDMIYTWTNYKAPTVALKEQPKPSLDIPKNEPQAPQQLVNVQPRVAEPEVVEEPKVKDAVNVAKELISGTVLADATVFYGFNKKDLTTESMLAINSFITKLGSERPKLLILGYADAIGGGASNKLLSEQRAQAVKDYMVKKKGYPANQIEVIGKGQLQLDESELVPDAKDEKERLAAARKAEIKLLEAVKGEK